MRIVRFTSIKNKDQDWDIFLQLVLAHKQKKQRDLLQSGKTLQSGKMLQGIEMYKKKEELRELELL